MKQPVQAAQEVCGSTVRGLLEEKSQLKAAPGLITGTRRLHQPAGLVCACTALAGWEEVMHTEAVWKETLPDSLIGHWAPFSGRVPSYKPNFRNHRQSREEPGQDVSIGTGASGKGYVCPGPLRLDPWGMKCLTRWPSLLSVFLSVLVVLPLSAASSADLVTTAAPDGSNATLANATLLSNGKKTDRQLVHYMFLWLQLKQKGYFFFLEDGVGIAKVMHLYTPCGSDYTHYCGNGGQCIFPQDTEKPSCM